MALREFYLVPLMLPLAEEGSMCMQPGEIEGVVVHKSLISCLLFTN